ncbi:MAG: hypothetical protein LYZ70_04540 [Nitrososphaerales archaeon]|nr:hypothetical protein [Nitrososphaerales archaeon]
MTREIGWFEEFNPECSTIVLSANVFESFPKAFIRALIRFGKPFVIDPVTYILRDDDTELKEKRWYSKLASFYRLNAVLPSGERVLGLSHLLNADDTPTNALGQLVANVMRYQRARIVGSSELQVVKEIEEFEGRTVDEGRLVPRWIIPPYFLANAERWVTANKRCMEEAVRNKQTGEKVFGVITFDESLLGFEVFTNKILTDYNIEGLDGYLIWISDFKESVQSPQRLKAYIQFVQALARLGKPIYNMYGGLFSFLLDDKGLTGACHSICYGESKDANAEGGGIMATIRYYYESLRIKVPYARVPEILGLVGGAPRCDCEACRTLFAIQGDSPEDRGVKMELCAKHFLHIRRREIGEINSGRKAELLESFNSNYQSYSTADRYNAYDLFYSHLHNWIEALA